MKTERVHSSSETVGQLRQLLLATLAHSDGLGASSVLQLVDTPMQCELA